MKKGITKKLTKDYILSLISYEELYTLYLNKFDNSINIDTINNCIDYNDKISNPLRVDTNPSLGFKYVKDKLKFRDFATGFSGDVFDLIGYIYKYNTSTKGGFYNVLKQILYDIHTIGGVLDVDFKPKELDIKRVKADKTIIEPEIRNWNEDDAKYWSKFGITFDVLNVYKVYPIQSIRINPSVNTNIFYRYNPANPAYAYFEGIENNIMSWRIYFPKTNGSYPKFITNFNKIQGLHLYDSTATVLIIVKSLKDVMTLDVFINSYYPNTSITFIAPASESQVFDAESIKWFVNNHKFTFSLYDFDYTGITNANKLRHLYHIEPLFITNGRFNTYDYKVKDIAELRSTNDINTMFKLIKQVLNYLKDEQSI
jgi:hypothetical protein